MNYHMDHCPGRITAQVVYDDPHVALHGDNYAVFGAGGAAYSYTFNARPKIGLAQTYGASQFGARYRYCM
jgi:hypothetical protein